MTLKINDMVDVVIVKWQLCGLHKVKIIGYECYDGLLIPIHKEHKWSPVYYLGLKLSARLIRIDNHLVDLLEVPIPSSSLLNMS